MKVLFACEFSGVVREAFKSKGHDVWSCDLLDTEIPGNHFKEPVENILFTKKWYLVIAHPPCTHLSCSGARWFKEKQAEQKEAIEFFKMFIRLKCKWAIENPIGIMSRQYRKPDQIIQPWMFGNDASKATCLWLNRLPKLIPTKIIQKPLYANQTPSGQNKLGPSKDRWKERSRTYRGIADAMASQWG